MPEDRTNKVSCTDYRSEIEITLEVLGGKWKALLLWQLCSVDAIRFNAFRRMNPKISQKMLTQQLRSLEQAGLVERRVYEQVPPMVEYALSAEGETLKPLLLMMEAWGKRHLRWWQGRA